MAIMLKAAFVVSYYHYYFWLLSFFLESSWLLSYLCLPLVVGDLLVTL